MSCCKIKTQENPYIKNGELRESGNGLITNKIAKWVVFSILFILSPLLLPILLYILFKSIVMNDNLNASAFFLYFGKLIKTHMLINAKPEIDLGTLEIYENQ
jgi:hypothetical protein